MSTSDGAPSSPISAGELLLGRYRVLGRLAEGGHSVVFRAEDERLRRPACVKLLQLPTRDPGFRSAIEARFVAEAFLLARLAHPATIKIFDFGYFRAPAEPPEEGLRDIPFQVTELISGGPMSRWVKKRGRLLVHEVLSVLAPIARALAEVHKAGVAHLDVKPQNILLARTAAGRDAKLADFGISENLGQAAVRGGRQVLLYSVNWAAPEQMVGEPIDASADVYALALVTVFALTGRLVFCEPDSTRAYRMRKASCDALVDAVAGTGLPDGLVDLLIRAIHFRPSLRISDVMEFFHQVERALLPLQDAPVPGAASIEESGPSPVNELFVADNGLQDRSTSNRVTAANLWSLSPEMACPTIAGRKVNFVQVGASVDLEVSDRIRLRVAFVPEPDNQVGLHVKGLNCFVSVAGRRPSSAVTLEGSAMLEFISAGGERLGQATATFATEGTSRTVVSVERDTLVVPSQECHNLIALDFGVGHTCALLYAGGKN